MKNAFLSVLRHLLTAGGALVVANNPTISNPTVETASGALIALAGAAWGVADEYKAEKKAKAARKFE